MSEGPIRASRRARPRRVLLACAAIGLTLVAAAAGLMSWGRWRHEQQLAGPDRTPRGPWHKPAPRADDYVGSAACSECHREVAERYATHPMARSLAPLSTAEIVEDYEQQTTFQPSRHTRYAVERDGDRFVHHEIALDREGLEIYDQAVPVHYAVGSGRRGRSYILDRGGFLFMSPISWYSSKKQWDLSPGYVPEGHQRFGRAAAERCLTCHVGRYALAQENGTSVAQRFQQPPFLELGIGCERCHGPGQSHIKFHRNPSGAGTDPIVNPVRLPAPQRDSICNQCHLQGDAQVLRYGRDHDDFRPGDHVGDIWTVFLGGGTGVERGRDTSAISHVEQMHASRCFQRSDGRLGCISCHDPHSVPAAREVAEYYRSRCLECHDQQGCSLPMAEQQAEPAAGSCIACHMPRLSATDIPHTTQTDHRVLARPKFSPGAPPSVPPEERIFERAAAPLDEWELARAQGLMLAGRAETSHDRVLAARVERLLEPVLTAAPDDVQLLDALALMQAMQGRVDDAVALWQQALDVEPDQQEILYSLLLIYANRRDAAAGREVLERLIAANPWNSEVQARYAELLRFQGDASKALEAAERGLDLNPGLAPLHHLHASLLEAAGDTAGAATARRTAERLTDRSPRP